tara:strand:+ start:5494 stop:5808 length:315 start_codon:yes stop_codon:yes gene_type:complete
MGYPIFEEFKKSQENNFEKAVYKNTAENRKLGRVGQEYGGGKKKEGGEDKGTVSSGGKSEAASFVLKTMDSQEDPNYTEALSAAMKKFPNTDKKKLEKELDKYI